MKKNFTFLLFTCLFALLTFSTKAQSTGDYRSAASGDWGINTNWERYDGASWVTAPSSPTSSDGVITILSPHTITVNAAVTADQITVDAGGTLTVNNASLTLSGAGTQLTVNGTLNLDNNSITTSTSSTILVNGVFNWTTGTLAAATTSASGATVNLTGNVTKTLNSNFTNNGIFNWATGATAGGISMTGSVFTNNGTINEQFQSGRGFTAGSGTSFINNGVFNKTTANTFFNNSLPFTNSVSGTLAGIGDYVFNFGTITNNGTVSPGGNSPAILNVRAGSVSAQNATIRINLINNSGVPGTSYDQLNLTATAPFSIDLSTLTLTLTDPGLPIGNSYTILTTDGTNGTFNTGTTFASIPPSYSVVVNATTVVLTKNAAALPAIWDDFKAIAKNNNSVDLTWNTLQEINTSHFLVEHSTDGINYKVINTIQAKGNSEASSLYSLAHKSPSVNSRNFYRLQLVDLDGKKSYSAVRIVKFDKGKVKALTFAPNPVANILNISVQETVEIRLTDSYGKTLRTGKFVQGNHQIDMSTFTAGIYYLSIISNGTHQETHKIVKQ